MARRRNLKCKVCGRKCANPQGLAAHLRFAHKLGKGSRSRTKHKCNVCGKEFGSVSGMLGHKRFVHEGRNPCGKKGSSGRRKAVNRVKMHKCDLCGFKAKRAASLGVHKFAKHGVRKAKPVEPPMPSHSVRRLKPIRELAAQPSSNGMSFCPYCGHQLVKSESPIREVKFCAVCGAPIADLAPLFV